MLMWRCTKLALDIYFAFYEQVWSQYQTQLCDYRTLAKLDRLSTQYVGKHLFMTSLAVISAALGPFSEPAFVINLFLTRNFTSSRS